MLLAVLRAVLGIWVIRVVSVWGLGPQVSNIVERRGPVYVLVIAGDRIYLAV